MIEMIHGHSAADLQSRPLDTTPSRLVADTLEHVLPIPVVREPERRKTSTVGAEPGQNRSERLDRLVNITLASLGLFLAAPIMLVFAILVKLTSPGPIFYAQARVGLDRRRSGATALVPFLNHGVIDP